MGALLGTYVSAGMILIASLLIGRALLLAFGRRRASFLEGAVGLALLLVVGSIAIRLPGEEAAFALIAALLVVASAVFLVIRSEAILGPSVGIGLPAALFALLAVSLLFVSSGQIGIPGVGLNNDMASHLIYAEWLLDPDRLEPPGIQIGYPIGPHAIAVTLATVLDAEVQYAFIGLLVSLPVLIAVTSLAVLRELAPGRRILAALLVSSAYLTVSVLGIAGFKELIAAMFLIATALGLREIERSDDGRVAIVVGIAVITAGMIAAYSYPGVIWLALTIGIWIAAELLRARIDGPPGAARALVRRSLPIAIPALVVLGALGLAMLPRAIDFLGSGAWETITETDSKLRYAVSPLESLGVWPSGEWLLSTTDVASYWIFGAIGIAALAFGVTWWIARRDLAVPSALLAAGAVYVGTQVVDTGLYVEAKALVIPASLVMLVVVYALLSPGGGWPKRVFATGFVVLASYSSFLALRDAVVAPSNRFSELAELRDEIEGERVLSLTSDRFTDYGLRTAEVFSPAANAEYRVDTYGAKKQRLPVDFDSVTEEVLNQFSYAVTTTAAYQSQAPPGWELAKESESYRLWRRVAETPTKTILAEEARPGRVFRCRNPKYRKILAGGGEALVWPRPVIAKRLYWQRDGEIDNRLAPGEETSQQITLPPGDWKLSLQYASPVTSVVVRAPGTEAELPAGVEAAIPYRPDQGPYWRAESVSSDGRPITVSAEADEGSGTQRLLGVDAEAVIGNLTAARVEEFENVPTAAACGRYVDHVIGGFRVRSPESAASNGSGDK